MKEMQGYTRVAEQNLEDIGAVGTEWIHERSGAHVVTVEAPQDSNKVFAIAFNTPPRDDCGIPHILEHSVLCGSERFPLKDPFVELAKGSVNTFLNAMTYPDRTVYPVASQNDQDLRNLMSVYMDAVFHPNILKNPQILMQEGWHYELEEADAPLTIKGVVYNEMRGVYSEADSVLERQIMNSLLPGTPYAFESGGDPKAIAELTQEAFLAFYREYYHPSNSYLYLYGDMVMEEYLTWLDEAYLSAYDRRESYVPAEMFPQPGTFKEMARVEKAYSVTEGQGEEEGYFAYNFLIKEPMPETMTALYVLEYLLLDMQGAPLKKALVDAGIGKSVYGMMDAGAHHASFSVIAKGVRPDQQAAFVETVDAVLGSLAQNGFTEKQKLAPLNRYEFQLLEADHGYMPEGLYLCLEKVLPVWMFGQDPFRLLQYRKIMKNVREEVENGLLEKMIREEILNNPDRSLVVLKPQIDLSQAEDRELAERLAAYKASLDEEELRRIMDSTAALLQAQEEEDPEEIRRMVPHLRRADLKRNVDGIEREKESVEDRPLIYVPSPTSIEYRKIMFTMEGFSPEELSLACFLTSLLGCMDTDRHSYEEWAQESNIHTGGISMNVLTVEQLDGAWQSEFWIASKCLAQEDRVLNDLLEEALLRTSFDDTQRLKELLEEEYEEMKASVEGSGHVLAIERAIAHLSPSRAAAQYFEGVEYIRFIQDLVEHFEERKDVLAQKLAAVARRLFVRQRVRIGCGCRREQKVQILDTAADFIRRLPSDAETISPFSYDKPEKVNEGLVSSGLVQYNVLAGFYDMPYCGSMQVARQILSLDFLWNRLRVQGGAYGAFAGLRRLGNVAFFGSYRDPALEKTYGVYDEVADYFRTLDLSEEELEKYVLGTIGGIDTPLTPASRVSAGITQERSGISAESNRQLREQVLDTTVEDLRALAAAFDRMKETGVRVTLGSREAIEASQGLFDRVMDVL